MDPVLVLLHGFTQTRQSWRRTAQALAPRYRALVPDLPGHGQAEHRTPSFDACAAYVRALAPARTFALAGYSMGGRIALHSAFTLGPSIVTRLVLVGASPGIADPAERAARRAPTTRSPTASRRSTSRPSRANGARSRCSRISRRAWPRARTPTGCATRPPGSPRRCAAWAPGVMEPLWDRLPALAIPVTLIVGERDEKFRALAAAMLERLPNATLAVIPGAGHAAQLEDPAAVAAAI